MFPKSIRWRLQLWLAFLLLCVLSGFGVTVHQLQRNNQIAQIDDDLEQRVAALSLAVRGGPPPDFGPGHPPGDGRPGWPDFDDGGRRPPPPRGRPEGPPPDHGREMRSERGASWKSAGDPAVQTFLRTFITFPRIYE